MYRPVHKLNRYIHNPKTEPSLQSMSVLVFVSGPRMRRLALSLLDEGGVFADVFVIVSTSRLLLPRWQLYQRIQAVNIVLSREVWLDGWLPFSFLLLFRNNNNK